MDQETKAYLDSFRKDMNLWSRLISSSSKRRPWTTAGSTASKAHPARPDLQKTGCKGQWPHSQARRYIKDRVRTTMFATAGVS